MRVSMSRLTIMNKVLGGFVATNICGIALYTYLFLRIVQSIQGEQRNSAEFADGIAYAVSALPVLGFFVAADLIWIAVMLNQHRKHKDSLAAALLGVIAVVAWIATVLSLRYVL